jgi:predicted transcriptional regulator
MTYAMAIDFATEIIKNGTADFHGFTAAEYMEKLEALKTSLAKRNSGSRKPTKTQRENESVKADILGVLSDEGKQCKDIAEALSISGQKCSALLKQLVDSGLAEKYSEKRVTYFKAVA